MAKAFKCDRCKEYFEGISNNHTDLEFAWLPQSHSYKLKAKFKVDDFQRDRDNGGWIQPDLCQRCVADIMLLLVTKMGLSLEIAYTSKD